MRLESADALRQYRFCEAAVTQNKWEDAILPIFKDRKSRYGLEIAEALNTTQGVIHYPLRRLCEQDLVAIDFNTTKNKQGFVGRRIYYRLTEKGAQQLGLKPEED